MTRIHSSTAFLWASLCAMAYGQERPLSVCEALAAPRGQTPVVIRAIAGLGQHGAVLDEGLGGEPCPGWPQRFFTAPSVIGLWLIPGRGVTMTDSERIVSQGLLLRLAEERHRRNGRVYMITAKGTLIRKPLTLIFRKPDGSFAGWGFGLDGGELATFVVRSIIQEGYR